MAKASCPRPTAPASGLLVRAIARAPGPPSAAPRKLPRNQWLEARPSRRASAFSALPTCLGNTELPSRDTDETIATFGRSKRGLILAPTEIQKRFGACNDLLPSLPCRRGARRPGLFDRPGLALSDVRAQAEL